MDFVSAQGSGLDGISDPVLLDRAAAEGRVLVSHDRRTMIDHFRDHLTAGKSFSNARPSVMSSRQCFTCGLFLIQPNFEIRPTTCRRYRGIALPAEPVCAYARQTTLYL